MWVTEASVNSVSENSLRLISRVDARENELHDTFE